MKMPSFTFCEGRKQAMSDKNFLSPYIMNLDMQWLIEIQLQKSSLAFNKVSELE